MPTTILVCPFDKKRCAPRRSPNGELVLCAWYKFEDDAEPKDLNRLPPGHCMFETLYKNLQMM